ncbi:MAG: putative type I restriction enzymeP M protein [Candidatus Ordinivivax streblomastigis]|uniref:Putative type I restriction enzymeP M protein n=1 Tax=Candidatus Ordinivivax streblomastigis TaxID=2540710 RepID=A0A5M8NVV1_9BACT|nr:MAG: putative type I restriction enzymeP M protein [Candidatus Ordinivivax streblomastigis]
MRGQNQINMDYTNFISQLGFIPKENTSGIFHKKYMLHGGYEIEFDLTNKKINYGTKIISENKTTQNFSQPENFVVLECVNRLLEKGYKPSTIILEKTYPAGHGTSGRLDICVTRDDGTEYLLIECKTYGKEFDKEFNNLKKNGGQLFTYFKFSNKPDIIMLYASELKGKEIIYRNEIVKIEDDYRIGDVKDFYEKWNKLTKDNGVWESPPYNFLPKAYTIEKLEDIRPEDSSFIFNRFLEILRHNVVSDKGNAFNRIFTLFLCKIYDEKVNEGTDNELGFQWFNTPFQYEGKYYAQDDHISFQLRLTDLYKNGMYEFLEKVVTDFSETEFKNQFPFLAEEQRPLVWKEFSRIRLEKNNEFAIKDVYDEQSFYDNAVVVKEIVELLQKYKLRYAKKQQYLSDFFELLLTTGLKQESGQFFTPVPVAQFIIKSLPIDEIVEEKLSSAKIDNDTLLPYIMDYAAGSGHFITEMMHEIQRLIDKKEDKKYNPSVAKKIRTWKDDHFAWAINYIYGIEKDYRLVKVGKVGCYLHGDGLANVIHSDGLARFAHQDYKGKLLAKDNNFPQENKQFDIIVSNPPYSVSAFKNNASKYYNEKDFEIYNSLTDNSSEIECLFIERAKQLLKDDGVAGVILPSSILSNSGIYTKAREIILQYFDIIAITELGSNTFMATSTNTVVLFLRRRNNYKCVNLRSSVDRFLTDLQDVTLNGIEKPISKYASHVWEDITFYDYLTLLQKTPNQAIEASEIYKEYRNKIKTKTEKDFWDTVIETEKEKLYYFILTYPQKTVLVKTGEKEAEKRFLGYEFSNRRGGEGIHPIQRGKTIDECTQLFDENSFVNPEKASTCIYDAFNKDYSREINENLKENISRVNLVDMLTFDRATFEKNISTSVKKKVILSSKYQQTKIEEIFVEIKNGKDVYQSNKVGKYRVSRIESIANAEFDINATKWTNDKVADADFLKKGDILFSHINSVWYLGKTGFFDLDEKVVHGVNLLRFRPNTNIALPKYLYRIFKTKEFIEEVQKYAIKAANQASVNVKSVQFLKIPLPPKEIQEKIVAEIEVLEKKEQTAKENVASLKESIKNKYLSIKSSFEERTLSNEIEIIGGGTPSTDKSEYWDGNIPWLSIVDFKGDNRFVEHTEKKITEFGLKNSSTKLLNAGDIIISARGTVGELAQLKSSMAFNQSCYGIKAKKNIDSGYLYYALKFEIEQFKNNAYGAIFDTVTTKTFDLIKIPLPPLSEQQKIVSEIEKIETQINELKQQITKLPQQKEEILKKYL